MDEQRVHTSERVDKILELLDVGDQHTTLAHYGYADDTDLNAADGFSTPGATTVLSQLGEVVIALEPFTQAFADALQEISAAIAAFIADLPESTRRTLLTGSTSPALSIGNWTAIVFDEETHLPTEEPT